MRRSGTSWALAAFVALGLGGAAHGAGVTPGEAAPIATGDSAAPPAEAVDPHAAPTQIAWPPLPADEEDALDGPLPPRKVHGMIEAGIGTGGYREVGGMVNIPIGQSGDVTVAVQKTEGAYGRYRWR
jgi:hypothetical protein